MKPGIEDLVNVFIASTIQGPYQVEILDPLRHPDDKLHSVRVTLLLLVNTMLLLCIVRLAYLDTSSNPRLRG